MIKDVVSPDVYALKKFGGGSGSIVMDNVQCTGNEASLLDCFSASVYDCEHYEDAGVRCLSGKIYVIKVSLYIYTFDACSANMH